MSAWSAWHDDVLTETPGVLQALAEYHIKRAVTVWCERTRCLRKDAAIDDAGGSGLRTPPTSIVPSGTRLVSVLRAKWDGKDLEMAGRERLDEEYPGQDWLTLSATAPLFLLRDRVAEQGSGFYLVPYPTAATTGKLRITVALAPTEAATTVDDSVYNEFRDSIAAGAKASLMAMPGVSWSNPQLSAYHMARFNADIATAAIKSDRGADRQRLRTAAHFF